MNAAARRGVAALGAAWLLGVLWSCGALDVLPPARRVILVALDGADWSVIEPLIAEGRLPAFARMRSQGASGRLRSMEPIFSPVLWATISTGVTPERHGIRSFTVEYEGDRVPVTANLFRVSRVWEILSRRGRKVGVVGWWSSWPASEVNGFLLSERTWPLVLGQDGWPVTSTRPAPLLHRTYPESLFAEIEPLIVTRDQLGREELEQMRAASWTRTEGTRGPSVADVYAKDTTFLRITEALYPEEPPDFFTVYFELPDVVSHYFWKQWRYSRLVRFGEPTRFSKPGRQGREAALREGESLERAYEFADRALARVLDLAEPGTLVLVVSDHGYGETPSPSGKSGKRKLHIGDGIHRALPDWHRLDGVILAWGHGVAPGVRVEGASVLDVTPTVLYALGEPVAADMDGKVVSELFDSRFSKREASEIATYETEPRVVGAPLPSPEDDGHLELLRSLGYLE